MSKLDQEQYIKWIENVLQFDRKKSKDERLYCPYYDVNNHPQFSCKHYNKHRDESAQHRCTLCLSKHAPFQCVRAQVNGGVAKPNWAKQEYKLARTEDQAPDLRWDRDQAPPPPPPPTDAPPQEAQQQAPIEEQQPMRAAAAMMHGLPSNMHPSISRQSAACPPIHENRERAPQAQEEQPQYPQPGYRIPANIWNFDIENCSNQPGPMASFLRHVATMQSPENPSYANLPVHPVKEARELQREATFQNVAGH